MSKRVSFLGHFGKGNFGNESTLIAILEHLRLRVPEAEVTCICTGPDAVAADYNIRTVDIGSEVIRAATLRKYLPAVVRKLLIGVPSEIYRWFLAFAALRSANVVIVPGTGLLTDAYSLVGWGPYSTFKWLVIAKLCRCKVVFVSVGAGPLYSALGRGFVKAALSLADFRSYRDMSSVRYLKSIGFAPANDRVYPDLVFSLPEAIASRNGNGSRRRSVVGLGLMEYAGRYSVDRPNESTYRDYLENLVLLAGWLLAHDYDVRLLIGDRCDRAVTEEFGSLLKERLAAYDSSRIIDEPADSVEQLVSQLARTDFVVATRFHNLILAMLNNKPVVAISFHHKCTSLMSSMGLSEYCLDINNLKAAEFIEKVRDLEQNAGQLKALIKERTAHCREALEEQYELIFKYV